MVGVQASCPLWDECGGLQKFIERDQQYEDPPHNEVRRQRTTDDAPTAVSCQPQQH